MANEKVTALAAITTATTDDILYIVDDPGGTPVSKKITFGNAQNSLAVNNLTVNRLVVGGGATTAPSVLASLGTTTTVLHGNAAGAPTFSAVVEADITLSDNVTNDVSAVAHGFAPKFPNNTTTFLRGDGTYAAPVSSFSWGSSASGTTADGLTLTLSNSSNDAAGALKLIAGNTQANQPVLANLQIGTSGNVMGVMIQGTGSITTGAVGTGSNHLTIWGNTANNNNYALSVGNGTSYTETAVLTTAGQFGISPKIASTQCAFQIDIGNASAGGLVYTASAGNGTLLAIPLVSTSESFGLLSSTSFGIKNHVRADVQMFDFTVGNTSASTLYTTARTADFYTIQHNRIHGNNSITDNFIHCNITRDTRKNGTGTTLAQGSVLTIQNLYTQTTGTLTDSVNVLKVSQNASSTGDIQQWLIGSTVKAAFTSGGNLALGMAAAGDTAANGVLALSNGATAPTTSVDMAQLYSVDLSAGNATLGIRTETAVVTETIVSDRTLSVVINGTTYKICLKV